VTELGLAAWPPSPPIRTARLLLRAAGARDRPVFIDLLASAEVHAYLGGPRPRDELERELPETPGQDSGVCAVQLGGAMIGEVILRRAAGERGAGKAELGYLFLPQAWGSGYAAEACEAALGWLDSALPGEPVVLFTQTANARSMRLAAKLGFTEVERFRAWDAEQWFGMRPPVITCGQLRP
jgi:RimJ/RimL family protein N-acetyltransferase